MADTTTSTTTDSNNEFTEVKHQLFPAIEPFSTGILKVSDIHEIYYEQSGKEDGKPVLYLHGGPGGGTWPLCRRYFDPDFYRIILIDQRGCGKSKPLGELKENTTWELVADIEKLRTHLGIDKWLVFGGSWGSTLSLTYSITHPERVKGLIIYGIFTVRRSEVLWYYHNGASIIYPDFHSDFINPIPKNERGDLISAYYRRLTSDDREVQLKYARSWAQWELRTSRLVLDPEKVEERLGIDDWVLTFARIECHYFVHGGFFDEDDYILNNLHKLASIPCTIIQGRYDMVTPITTAWAVHKGIPHSELVIIPKAGHSLSEPDSTIAAITATEKYKTLP